MEYKVIIQENLENGSIYIHNFPLEPNHVEDAKNFRMLTFHSDCVFIAEYCLN